MTIPGVYNPQTILPIPGLPPSWAPLGGQAASVQAVAGSVFRSLNEAFQKAIPYSLKTIPIQIILAIMHPVYGVFLTFVALYITTLAGFTAGVGVCNLCKKQPLPPKPPEPDSPQFSGPSILEGSSKFQVTEKFYQQLEVKAISSFTPLSKQQIETLLKKEPSLKTHRVAIKTMSAYDSIMRIHEQGIPEKIFNKMSNEELRDQMRYILYRVNEEKDLSK